jgi:hypothetical protein
MVEMVAREFVENIFWKFAQNIFFIPSLRLQVCQALFTRQWRLIFNASVPVRTPSSEQSC